MGAVLNLDAYLQSHLRNGPKYCCLENGMRRVVIGSRVTGGRRESTSGNPDDPCKAWSRASWKIVPLLILRDVSRFPRLSITLDSFFEGSDYLLTH
jgi:hypothetical protein